MSQSNLKEFLDNVELLKITRKGKALLVAKHNGTVSFHLAGAPENAVKREADFCSPNAVAEICYGLGIELSSADVVRISNFC